MEKPWSKLHDALLAERVNRGDVEAFAEAYDRFAPRLFRHLLLRTNQKETAEDLLSQTFLRAWEYVRAGNALTYLQSFLYTVANNALTDHYRRDAHSPIPVEDITIFDRPDSDRTLPTIDASFDRAVIEAALAKLPNEYRDVLVMRFIDELEIKEIAQMTGGTPNAIYVRTHRALRALREHIDPRHAP